MTAVSAFVCDETGLMRQRRDCANLHHVFLATNVGTTTHPHAPLV